MKFRNKKLAGASLLVFATCALASCGGDRGYQGAVKPEEETRGVSIEFWTGFGSDISSKLEDRVLAELKTKYGITANHTTKGGYDNLQKAINLSASTITYPNIAVGYADHFAGYAASDIQLRLDEYIEADPNIPATRQGGECAGSDGVFHDVPYIDMDDFYPSFMVENQTIEYDENGKGYTLGLPFNKSTECLVYNNDFFSNEWVKSLGIAIPETWDDVKTVGLKIIAAVKPAFGKILGADGNVYETESKANAAGTKLLLNLTNADADTFFPFGYDSTANLFITGVRQWGGTYTEVDKETGQGYIRFNTDTTKAFLTYMKELAAEKVLAIPASFKGTSNYCSAYYVNHQCLMNIGSSAGLSNYDTGYQIDTQIAPVPYKDADHKFVISQGTNLCMFNKGSAAEKLASWKAIKYLATDGNALFATLTGYFPSCKSATQSETYQHFLTRTTDDDGEPLSTDDICMQRGAKMNATVYDATDTKWTKFVDPGFSGSSTVRTAVGNLMSEIIVNQGDVDATLATYVASLSDYVEA